IRWRSLQISAVLVLICAVTPLAIVLGVMRDGLWPQDLLIVTAIVLALAIGVLLLWRSFVAPLRRLAEQVRQVHAGQFGPITYAGDDDEIGDLARAFNAMGEHLQRSLLEARRERALLEAVLKQLPMGVVIRVAPSGDLLL